MEADEKYMHMRVGLAAQGLDDEEESKVSKRRLWTVVELLMP